MAAPATQRLDDRMWPTLVAHHGLPISYDRNGVGSSLTLVKGRRGIQLTSTDYTTSMVVDEWFALASDLQALSLTEPQRGDRILWTDPIGRSVISEVHLPGPTRQWDYVDPEGLIVQIYTVQVNG